MSRQETNAPKRLKLHLATFGCQMNTYDSDRLAGLMARYGYELTGSARDADLILVNTCSVRQKAEEKVYSLLGSYKGYKDQNPGLIIGVGGCVAQQVGEDFLRRVPHLDFVFGPGALGSVPELVEEAKSGRRRALVPEQKGFGGVPADILPVPRLKAQVTIMQGCDNFCSYCVVPYVRGRERSRTAESVLAEMRALVRNGSREILLLGQNVNSYRDPDSGADFAGLLEKACEIEGLWRIRFATSHPKDLSPELISAVASFPKVMKNLHLPPQSGSDLILKAMNRRYTRAGYLAKVEALREKAPKIALGGDVIVGFPGESEEDFKETLSLLSEVGYDYLYSFKYSDRPFAKASRLENKVPEPEIDRRLEELQSLQRSLQLKLHQQAVGEAVLVLVEGPAKKGPGLMTGRDECGRAVNFPGGPELGGSLVRVTIENARINSLMGRMEQPA